MRSHITVVGTLCCFSPTKGKALVEVDAAQSGCYRRAYCTDAPVPIIFLSTGDGCLCPRRAGAEKVGRSPPPAPRAGLALPLEGGGGGTGSADTGSWSVRSSRRCPFLWGSSCKAPDQHGSWTAQGWAGVLSRCQGGVVGSCRRRFQITVWTACSLVEVAGGQRHWRPTLGVLDCPLPVPPIFWCLLRIRS